MMRISSLNGVRFGAQDSAGGPDKRRVRIQIQGDDKPPVKVPVIVIPDDCYTGSTKIPVKGDDGPPVKVPVNTVQGEDNSGSRQIPVKGDTSPPVHIPVTFIPDASDNRPKRIPVQGDDSPPVSIPVRRGRQSSIPLSLAERLRWQPPSR